MSIYKLTTLVFFTLLLAISPTSAQYDPRSLPPVKVPGPGDPIYDSGVEIARDKARLQEEWRRQVEEKLRRQEEAMRGFQEQQQQAARRRVNEVIRRLLADPGFRRAWSASSYDQQLSFAREAAEYLRVPLDWVMDALGLPPPRTYDREGPNRGYLRVGLSVAKGVNGRFGGQGNTRVLMSGGYVVPLSEALRLGTEVNFHFPSDGHGNDQGWLYLSVFAQLRFNDSFRFIVGASATSYGIRLAPAWWNYNMFYPYFVGLRIGSLDIRYMPRVRRNDGVAIEDRLEIAFCAAEYY